MSSLFLVGIRFYIVSHTDNKPDSIILFQNIHTRRRAVPVSVPLDLSIPRNESVRRRQVSELI